MGAMMNEDRFGVVSLTIDPASVTTGTASEQTFTVPGLKVGDFVMVNKPSTSGIAIGHCRASAANTLAINFVNATAATVDPVAETYLVFWFRPEKVPTTINV